MSLSMKNNEEKLNMTKKYEVWLDFAETTSCHGVKEIVHSKHSFWKIFWSISVLFHLILLVYGCYSVIVDYLTAPTVTKVSIISMRNLTLPNLAFCNANGLNRTAMTVDEIPEKIQWRLRDLSQIQFQPDFLQIMESKNLTIKQFLIRYSYTCQELLPQGCSLGSTVMQDCCPTAEIIIHRHFGICYALKGKLQTTPGVSNGWRMKFRIPEKPEISDGENKQAQFHSFEAFTFADGLALEVENQYEHLNQNPLLMSKDQVVSVSMRAEQHLREGEDCEHNQNHRFSNVNSCSYWCEVAAFKEFCDCALFGYSESFYPDLRLCEVSDLVCLSTNRSAIRKHEAECSSHCKPLCENWSYKPSVTYTDLALKPYDINLRVQIGYSALEYTSVQEVSSFTPFMAISSIGGQAGLWMGCSILTLIHAITYCCWASTLRCTSGVKTVAKRDSLLFTRRNTDIRQSHQNGPTLFDEVRV